MEYRRLGRSDLVVSEISLGSWLTYGGGVERDTAEACMRAAFDAGVNFFDTANVYARGGAETFLGEALPAGRATATCSPPRSTSRCHHTATGLSAAQIAKQLDDSLRAAPRRPRRPLPVPPLRRRDAARGDHGGADARGRAGQDALHRLLGVDGAADPRRARPARRRGSCRRSRSTRCSGARPRPRCSRSAPRGDRRRSCGRRSRRACSPASTGRASRRRPTRARRARAWAGFSRAASTIACSRVCRPPAHRGGARAHPSPARARVGAPTAGGLVGDHRRLATRAGYRQCARERRPARARRGGADRGGGGGLRHTGAGPEHGRGPSSGPLPFLRN